MEKRLKALGTLVVRYRLIVMLAGVVIFGAFTLDDF